MKNLILLLLPTLDLSSYAGSRIDLPPKKGFFVSSVTCHRPCLAYFLSYVSYDCVFVKELLHRKLDGKPHTDITIFKVNRPGGQFSEKVKMSSKNFTI